MRKEGKWLDSISLGALMGVAVNGNKPKKKKKNERAF